MRLPNFSRNPKNSFTIVWRKSFRCTIHSAKMTKIFCPIYIKKTTSNRIFFAQNQQLSVLGQAVLSEVNHAMWYGIPQRRVFTTDTNFIATKKNERLKFDIQLSMGILRLLDDVQNGFSDSLRLRSRPFSLSRKISPNNIQSKAQLDTLLAQISPKNEHYQQLSAFLRAHLDTANMKMKLLPVPLTKEDSLLALQNAVKNMETLGYSFEKYPTWNAVDKVKFYQRSIGVKTTGKIDAVTQFQLEETPRNIAERIAWYMERARYEKKYPKSYLRVNIPEFQLYYFNDDTIATIHKVIVGKFGHFTPEVSSHLFRIQLFPYWNVPYKIATQEMLPEIKKNEKYLAKNSLVLMRGDKVIDPKKVRWKKLNKKNFPYKIRQMPGPKNSLGIIRFDFWNKFDVYLHDTPSKWYFKTATRDYSHGCVRTQDPLELAKKILEIDKNKLLPDSLDSLMHLVPDTIPYERRQRFIKLKKSVPIFLEYRTVAVEPVLKKEHEDKPDEYEEKVFLFKDIYRKDEPIIRCFFEKNDKNT